MERASACVVVGLARSGVAAAAFLARRGASVVAVDRKAEGELPAEALALRAAGRAARARGRTARETFTGGRRWSSSRRACRGSCPSSRRRARAGVAGDRRDRARVPPPRGRRVAAVTGTKGKSTTTAALGAMLREAGRDARVGGNIGAPLVGLVEGSTEATAFAVEVSSFQLEGIDALPPAASRSGSTSRPTTSTATRRSRPTSRPRRASSRTRRPEDWAVVNADDPVVLARGAPRARAPAARSASTGEPLAAGDGAFFAGGVRPAAAATGAEETLFARADVALPGAHLAGDLLVAAAAARAPGRARRGDRARRARLPRRRARARARGRRSTASRYYNDSKATNVEAARRSLEAFDRPRRRDPRRPLQGRRLRRARPAASPPAAARVLAIGEARGARRAALAGTRAGRARAVACARPSRAAAPLAVPGRRRAAGAGLLVLRHVPRLRRARPRVQGRGRDGSRPRGGARG